MKKFATLFFLLIITTTAAFSYPRLSILERFTNAGCAPCASMNNAWYTNVTLNMVAGKLMTHIVYNVDWPSATDPMFLLNSADNNIRRGLYGVNSVPWLQVNGSQISGSQAALESAVNSGNAVNSPFNIVIKPELFPNNVINVKVTIHREAGDVTVFQNTRLFVALTEKTIRYATPPGSNGETVFYSIARKMLPDAKGTAFQIPAPGDSVSLDLLYIPPANFQSLVNLDSLRIVAFIQRMDTKYIFQSVSGDIQRTSRLNSAFAADRLLGAVPLTVNFTDYSSTVQGNTINSWQWDFNNDGTVDATTQNPSYTYNEQGSFSVKLVVSDGVNTDTRILSGYIDAISAVADILVVNGIEYATYPAEMANFYNNSAGFGDNEVDVWDLFGDQGFNYLNNPKVKKVNYFNRAIPNDVLRLYPRVIWFGNNYGGDFVFWNAEQVVDFVAAGGNFVLATRQGGDYLTSPLTNYCGIQAISGLMNITEPLIALHDSLVNMTPLPTNTRAQFVTLLPTSEAIPIFDESNTTNYYAGFRIKKEGHGSFIYIAGRPYRFDNAASASNYDFIIRNWMAYSPPVRVDDVSVIPSEFVLEQNYPNPFNPGTQISYSLPVASLVSIKLYDVLGREIKELVNQVQPAGSHRVYLDAAELNSGIYFYTLNARREDGGGYFSSTRKSILLK